MEQTKKQFNTEFLTHRQVERGVLRVLNQVMSQKRAMEQGGTGIFPYPMSSVQEFRCRRLIERTYRGLDHRVVITRNIPTPDGLITHIGLLSQSEISNRRGNHR